MSDQPSAAEFIEVTHDRRKPRVMLRGCWTTANAGPLEAAVHSTKHQLADATFDIDAGGIEAIDTSGAVLLKQLAGDQAKTLHLDKRRRALLDFVPPYSEFQHDRQTEAPDEKRPRLERIGRRAFDGYCFVRDVLILIGRVAVRFCRNLRHPRAFRLPSIARHIRETGIDALLIIGLLAVSISMVITYQGAIQLRQFGAEFYTIDLTAIALLREMGVLVMAIMVAGRSGSAFAAEIGVMSVRDEVNALRTMGLDPIEVLVLPRIIALVITLPLLTFVADVIGLIGRSLMALPLLGVSFPQYIDRVAVVATPTTFLVGMIKAPVFAFIIAVIGCYQGLNVSNSAENIGKRTTLAVVQSIFVVILADALFSIAFSKAGV